MFCCSAAGDYDGAICQYAALSKEGSFEVLCGTALSLYLGKKIEESRQGLLELETFVEIN
jgi:hypothetical protein